MQINLPQNVQMIMDTLENAGYEAYAVGGCIRDSILGREPNDWDITTSAKPLQVKALFKRTIDTGIKHGTVTVLVQKETYEITTYRIDGVYEDSRHPKEVTFTGNLEEDLLRRDFTINAMAYSQSHGLIDLYGGLDDIENKTIRCVGNPTERFSEDALRILRAIRFASQFDYRIEEKTAEAIKKLCGNLKNISAERIQSELVKCLTGPHPEYLEIAWKLGVTSVILPQLDGLMILDQKDDCNNSTVGVHTLKALEYTKADKILRLAVLFHDIGKATTVTDSKKGQRSFPFHAKEGAQLTRQIMRALKFDTDTLNKVVRLVEYHDVIIDATPVAVRKAIHEIGEDYFPMLFDLKYANVMGQSGYNMEKRLHDIEVLKGIYFDIIERGDCISLKQLGIAGKDLVDMGMHPGKEIGDTLDRLLMLVLEDPSKNTKEILKAYI